jgi:hypothetical protein
MKFHKIPITQNDGIYKLRSTETYREKLREPRPQTAHKIYLGGLGASQIHTFMLINCVEKRNITRRKDSLGI